MRIGQKALFEALARENLTGRKRLLTRLGLERSQLMPIRVVHKASFEIINNCPDEIDMICKRTRHGFGKRLTNS